MAFGYILVTTNSYTMITTIEIAKILQKQQKKYNIEPTGFDAGLLGLGVARKMKNKDFKKK
tara:strand:- start:5240 stop:5422 length:183 start_codon:yes stop_codon:yes gene_type:complete